MIKVIPQMHIELQFTNYLHIYPHGPATYDWWFIELRILRLAKRRLKGDVILEFQKCFIGEQLDMFSVTQREELNQWDQINWRQKFPINKADQQWNGSHLDRKIWRIPKHRWSQSFEAPSNSEILNSNKHTPLCPTSFSFPPSGPSGLKRWHLINFYLHPDRFGRL